MGGSLAKPKQVQDRLQRCTTIIQAINELVQELSDRYQSRFLYPDFCNQVAMIYSTKLSHFRKQELDGVSYILGLTPDSPKMKQQICQKIVEHYTKKLQLVQLIQSSLSYCDNRLRALTVGPYCSGDPMIFESSECQGDGKEWKSMRELPADAEENSDWYEMVEEFQSGYMATIQRLRDILKQLRDYDEVIDEESLSTMERDVRLLLATMKKDCQTKYHMIETTTKRLSKEELEVLRQKHQKEKERRLARLAALRDSYNLPPLPQV